MVKGNPSPALPVGREIGAAQWRRKGDEGREGGGERKGEGCVKSASRLAFVVLGARISCARVINFAKKSRNLTHLALSLLICRML